MKQILIIEDEKPISNVLHSILMEEFPDYQFTIAEDGLEGLRHIEKSNFDLIISDVKMPKLSGIEILSKGLQLKPDLIFIMMSGHTDINTAIDCIKDGAYDFISKPIDINRLLTSVRNAFANISLKKENKILKKKISKTREMIGNSESLQSIKNIITKIAPSDARVLITGNSGVGKELIAHAIHNQSNRANSVMVEINCAAIPQELIESELFGHVKGSFTGAIKDKVGKFKLAHNGTLFLDEIGDMNLMAQAKILRVLQENKISPIGSDKEINVNVRVIAATNKDMKKEIAEGRFREDLYHRLSVIEIFVPPLDERKDDIPPLIEHFTKIIAQEQNSAPKKFSEEAINLLQKLSWTGNIRELRNIVERLIILGGNPISADDVKIFTQKWGGVELND